MNKDNYEVYEHFEDSVFGKGIVTYTILLEQKKRSAVFVDIIISEESKTIYAAEQGKSDGTAYETDPHGELFWVLDDYQYNKAKAVSTAIELHEWLYGEITWTDTEKLLVGLSTDKGDTLERE